MTQFVSNSQASQDKFVYEVLIKNKPYYAGTFLEIGCGQPIAINNTYHLEKYFNWSGILLDYNRSSYEECRRIRKSVCLCDDATTINWNTILPKYNTPLLMDYLSFDVDESSEASFDNFPFEQYKFKVITIEHDCYRFGNHVKEKMRKRLSSIGYDLVCADVMNINNPFEDWWVNPEFVSKESVAKFRCVGKEWTDIL